MAFIERIDPSHSDISLLNEHLVRYELVSQLTCGSGCMYFDLGCGTGFGLKTLQGRAPNSPLYGCDLSDEALARAVSLLNGVSPSQLLRLDLANSESYGAIEDVLKVQDEGIRQVLVCFEVIEHLDDFRALVDFLDRQIEAGAEVFLSVPNDAFFGTQNPFHRTMFGEDSLQELVQLFRRVPNVYKQYPIQGAIILPDGVTTLDQSQVSGKLLPPFADRMQPVSVASHFILHFGPLEGPAGPFMARFNLSELVAERQWATQREADLLYYRAEAQKWEQRVAELMQQQKVR